MLDAPDSFVPLHGKTVLLVHPAWQSCGSHQIFVSQARAYRALGARVTSLAVADFPGGGKRAEKAYFAGSRDLEADARFYARMPLPSALGTGFLSAAMRWLRGDEASILCAMAARSPLPAALAGAEPADLIHCNHFFCMPVALALRRHHGCPILLDTHDLQARQFMLRARARPTLPPARTFNDLLEIELAFLAQADILIHLNDEEAAAFGGLLPQSRHRLVYPTVKPVEAPAGGTDFIIFASANAANFLGVAWFLEHVMPLCQGIPVRIIGNIDKLVRTHAPGLFTRNAALFAGRVETVEDAYQNAAAILLPTTEGHGISIKTIEALSTGLPLIATPMAFRGMGLDPASLDNVSLATEADAFAAALRRAASEPRRPGLAREASLAPSPETSPTRRIYDRLFSFDVYCAALAGLFDKARHDAPPSQPLSSSPRN